jgi:predicted nicotinamide N-methyase
MTINTSLQKITLLTESIEIYVPDVTILQTTYLQQSISAVFPYWAKIWPAALATSEFLLAHTEYILNKKVFELAAGLGLPSFVAARYAKEVHCSDYSPDAVTIIQQSIEYNKLSNIHCHILNWHHLPEDLTADVLLLSDVNYNTDEFEVLYSVLVRFLQNGTTIVLTTPQRLMAKPFIEKIFPFVVYQEEIKIEQKKPTYITVLVLKQ